MYYFAQLCWGCAWFWHPLNKVTGHSENLVFPDNEVRQQSMSLLHTYICNHVSPLPSCKSNPWMLFHSFIHPEMSQPSLLNQSAPSRPIITGGLFHQHSVVTKKKSLPKWDAELIYYITGIHISSKTENYEFQILNKYLRKTSLSSCCKRFGA
jgi:hypothetical protein